MAAVCDLVFLKFKFLTVVVVKNPILHHRTKFRKDQTVVGHLNFCDFQDGGMQLSGIILANSGLGLRMRVCVWIKIAVTVYVALVRHFQPRVYHIWLSISLPCIICIVLHRLLNHGLCGSASPVLTATGFVNGRWQFSTPSQNPHALTDHQKICC